MSTGSLKENMDKEGESTKARVMLGRRVRKTRLMDEMDWWTRGWWPAAGWMHAGAGSRPYRDIHEHAKLGSSIIDVTG